MRKRRRNKKREGVKHEEGFRKRKRNEAVNGDNYGKSKGEINS